jgi:hypothetical protein
MQILRIIILAISCASVSNCGAIYAWDTMQLRSAQKQAAQKLLEDCNSGDHQACVDLASVRMQ